HPNLTTAKPNGLNSKCAKNFNKTTVVDYYNHWSELEKLVPQGIPSEHKWNMNEKGLQFGRGHQNSGAECAVWINEDSILKTFKYPLSHYKKKDDLITIASALRLLTEGTITTLLA
ncbi:hypothetical protein J132_03664, partial [Termitomyces sp. J132]